MMEASEGPFQSEFRAASPAQPLHSDAEEDMMMPPIDDAFSSPPASPHTAAGRRGDVNDDVYDIPVQLGETAVKLVIGAAGTSKKGVEASSPPAAIRQIKKPAASASSQPTSINVLRMSCPAVIINKSPASRGGVPSYLRSTATQLARVKNAPETIVVRPVFL